MSNELSGVKHVIAMSSGKGGVGKSTAAVNLALALQSLGQRVGIADVDIFGPSVPQMLGLGFGEPPMMLGGQIVPIRQHGLKVMSMGLVTDDDTPAIFRGPMVSKFISQFILGVAWGDLDFLILDLPPGTGDTQLSLAQIVLLRGAIVVTTPQKVSLNIALRGLRMFEKVRVPLLGIIENMSGWLCPHCGEETNLFLHGGGRWLADHVGVPFLGGIPVDPLVAEGGDAGRPVVLEHPESGVTKAYLDIAGALLERLERGGGYAEPIVDYSFEYNSDDPEPGWHTDRVSESADPMVPVGLRRGKGGSFEMLWADGVVQKFSFRKLRVACPCAACIDEHTGQQILDPKSVRLDIKPVTIFSVGQYALGVRWNDGHDTGIFTYRSLRETGQAVEQSSEA